MGFCLTVLFCCCFGLFGVFYTIRRISTYYTDNPLPVNAPKIYGNLCSESKPEILHDKNHQVHLFLELQSIFEGLIHHKCKLKSIRLNETWNRHTRPGAARAACPLARPHHVQVSPNSMVWPLLLAFLKNTENWHWWDAWLEFLTLKKNNTATAAKVRSEGCFTSPLAKLKDRCLTFSLLVFQKAHSSQSQIHGALSRAPWKANSLGATVSPHQLSPQQSPLTVAEVGVCFGEVGDQRGFDGVWGDVLGHEGAALPKLQRGLKLWCAQDCAVSSSSANADRLSGTRGGVCTCSPQNPDHWRREKDLTPGCYSLTASAVSTHHSTWSVPKAPCTLGLWH